MSNTVDSALASLAVVFREEDRRQWLSPRKECGMMSLYNKELAQEPRRPRVQSLEAEGKMGMRSQALPVGTLQHD